MLAHHMNILDPLIRINPGGLVDSDNARHGSNGGYVSLVSSSKSET